MSAKELQVKEKERFPKEGEQLNQCPVFLPSVDIFESKEAITLVADIPGVNPDALNIDLSDNELTIEGKAQYSAEENERFLLQEYEVGKYYRKFALSNVIDQAKISAELKDGVLRLVLPKIEEAKPRKIEVKAA